MPTDLRSIAIAPDSRTISDVLVNEERLLAERQKQVQLQGRSLSLMVEMIRALGGGYRAPET